MKTVTCKNCGTSNLVWYQNKKGNWVLVVPMKEQYERGIGRWVEPHNCARTKQDKLDAVVYWENKIEQTIKFFDRQIAENPDNEEMLIIMRDVELASHNRELEKAKINAEGLGA